MPTPRPASTRLGRRPQSLPRAQSSHFLPFFRLRPVRLSGPAGALPQAPPEAIHWKWKECTSLRVRLPRYPVRAKRQGAGVDTRQLKYFPAVVAHEGFNRGTGARAAQAELATRASCSGHDRCPARTASWTCSTSTPARTTAA
ncbi:hypothetical protein ARTHRO9AX_130090 [Arthrobacter sp. 9AX]|nr:hypothetical protein ARTHRO9AX_130090 [Arthrobacter sp. 9AX]